MNLEANLDPQEASTPRHPYLEKVEFPFTLPTHIYGAMLVVWHMRPVQQRRFPLQKGKERDFIRFLAWCATEGRRQFAILRNLPEWEAELGRKIRLPQLAGDVWGPLFSVAMFFHGVARMRYTFGQLLTNPASRRRVARSFWRGERHKRLEPPPENWQLRSMLETFGDINGLVEELRFPKEKQIPQRDLIETFGLQDVERFFRANTPHDDAATPRLKEITLPGNLRRSPLKIPFFALKTVGHFADQVQKRPNEFELSSVLRHLPPFVRSGVRLEHPFGVNLYGYAHSEIGIGEDVRLAAKALEAAGIPFCIINVKVGDRVSQKDFSMKAHVRERPEFAFNLFSVTGVEHARFICEQGLDQIQGRYSIGFWPWELPRWPSSCHHAYGCVNEIWGISSYVASAYRASCPHPVLAMTLPVELGEIGTEIRADFGLPADSYLYCFAFDINSKVTRKNPSGLIRAFQLAYPPKNRDKVGLVLKVSHADTPCEGWAAVKELVRKDPRIFVIEETMRKPQVLALFKACDCFVSLHRAEGFGRCIAEALVLGKQVITTGYSGNMDYCREPRVALVDHEIVQVNPGEYFWAQGQTWAHPDLRHAAELMLDVRNNPRPIHPAVDFSPKRVGEQYAARLQFLWQGIPKQNPA